MAHSRSDPVSTSVTTVEAKAQFSELINRAAFGKERILITRRGHPLVAVVPVDLLKRLEALEDQLDFEEAAEALRDFRKSEEKPVSLEAIARELGIDISK